MVKSLSDFINKGHSKPVVIVLDNGPIHRFQAIYDQISGLGRTGCIFILLAYL